MKLSKIVMLTLTTLVLLMGTTMVAFAADRVYGFNCYIPAFGNHRCMNNNYTMSHGKYARVQYTGSSNGYFCAWFAVRRVSNGAELGAQKICPGETKTVWTNTTGSTVEVYFTADSDYFFDDTLSGTYIFGPF